MKIEISKRKLTSYKMAEKVARELRYQLQASPTRNHIDTNSLFNILFKWMNYTGKIKYKRPI